MRGVNAVRRRNGVMLLLGSWAMMPLSLLLLLQILIASSDAIQDAVMAQLYAHITPHPFHPFGSKTQDKGV